MATAERKAVPELSIETSLIFERLKKAEVGEVVAYAEIEKIASRTMPKVYGNIQSAVRKMQREHGVLFATVIGEGVKRLDPSGCVGVIQDGHRRMGRAARRLMKKASCVAVGELSLADKTRFNVATSQVAMLEHVSKASTTKSLTAAVEKAEHALPIGKVLELLK